MEIIQGYRVTASNNSAKQRGSITVKNPDSVIVARVHSEHTRPLQRARNYMLCEERQDLQHQLRLSGVKEEVINQILLPTKQ